MRYLIGLDIGTSSVKGVLMEETGRVFASAKELFFYQSPQPGMVELEPFQYMEACCSVVKKLAKESPTGNIAAICASSASGNLLLTDGKGKPLTNIIGWQDERGTSESKELLKKHGIDTEQLYEQIGWPFMERSFPLAQLCYLKKHQPELLKQCGQVCMSTEYLYHAWTGKWGISGSAGTPFYLIDQRKGTYIEPLLNALGLDRKQVPPVLSSGSVLGEVREDMAEALGVTPGTPVVLGTFDHPSAARGVGILDEGEMLLSCGTSWVVFMPVSDRRKGISAKVLVDPFLAPKGNWAVMASVTSLSERINLYMERYIGSGEDKFQKLSKLAAESVPGANGLFIDMSKEPEDGRIQSFALQDIARAIMEGVVYMLKEKLNQLKAQGITANKAVMVGGPSEDPVWRVLIEEICGIPVRVVHGAYAGAVGAAVMAGIGVGIYKDEHDAAHTASIHLEG